MKPCLDTWLPDPALRVSHRRESNAAPERLWNAARTVRLCDAALLGRLVRWRIPGLPPELTFDQLFREPPFAVLHQEDGLLLSGLVGRIWTLRRDYPRLSEPDEFRRWSEAGTARVLFGTWVQQADAGRSALHSETRVEPIGPQGRLGVAMVRPLIGAFHPLVGSDALAVAARRAEQQS